MLICYMHDNIAKWAVRCDDVEQLIQHCMHISKGIAIYVQRRSYVNM